MPLPDPGPLPDPLPDPGPARVPAAIRAAAAELLDLHRERLEARRLADLAEDRYRAASARFERVANAFSAATRDGDRYLCDRDLVIVRRGPGLSIEPRERSRRAHD